MEERTTPNDSFWSTLREDGRCSEELVVKLKEELEMLPRQPLGSFLIRGGVMTIQDLGALLQLQAGEPEMMIGQLAVREGLCDQEELEDALEQQRQEVPHPIEFLFQDSRLDREILIKALIRYVDQLELRIDRLQEENESSVSD